MAATDVDLWVPLASGALGIVGALAGVGLTQRATRRREDRRWERERELDQVRYERERLERQRERRAALYVDMAEYVQSQQSDLALATDEYASRREGIPDLQHPDRLTARVKLYATPQVEESWSALVRAVEFINWTWNEGDVNHSANNSWIDPDHPAAVGLSNAIERVQSMLRVAIDEEA